MCIVAFAWQVLDGLPLCLISNRDEFYHRPSSKLHVWSDSPVIAGQDLQSGGTWMGITKQGRWAIITNFRDGADQHSYVTSRGEVIQSFLESDLTPIRFAQQLELKQCDYAGFNLFVGDLEQAVYMSNRGEAPQVLAKGVYVVSNGLMSEDWQKTQHLRKRFTQEFLPMLQLSETYVSEKDIQTIVWDILEDERRSLLSYCLKQVLVRKWRLYFRQPLFKVRFTVHDVLILSELGMKKLIGLRKRSKVNMLES